MADRWVLVARLPLNQNLPDLSAELQRRGIEHRLAIDGGAQHLWLANPADEAAALALVAALRDQDGRPTPQSSGIPRQLNLVQQIRRTPVVAVTLLLGICGALLVDLLPVAIHWFTFQDFVVTAGANVSFHSVEDTLAQAQYWRLITPVFLHFGLLHIVFNGLWLWEFGRRVEALSGSFGFLGLFAVIAVGSNIGQYLWSGASLFGGLSGVVYGLLGYIWLRGALAPHPLLLIPRGIVVFMLIWLVLCLLGVVDLFIQGGVANGAHVAGLVIGLALGAVAGLGSRHKIP